jgi:hypothetical protein
LGEVEALPLRNGVLHPPDRGHVRVDGLVHEWVTTVGVRGESLTLHASAPQVPGVGWSASLRATGSGAQVHGAGGNMFVDSAVVV